MDRLLQERLARLVLDKLLDSGELRSVASQRALALRMFYLPPSIRLDVPPDDDYLPLLDPNKQGKAIAGLRDAILRIVQHEEGDHWVVVDPDLQLDVHLREHSRVPRIRPIYEPDVEDDRPQGSRLGEPRLRLSWGTRSAVLRERHGLLKVDLGPRRPGLVLIEGGASDEEVAWLYATGKIQVIGDDTKRARRYPARTRIPVTHDMTFIVRAPFGAIWQRKVRMQLEVLGLTRLGRATIAFTNPTGQTVSWDRNHQPHMQLGGDFVLHARERDLVEIENVEESPASLIWFDGKPLTIPGGSRVAVQGSHLKALVTTGGGAWAATLPSAGSAPPPRVILLDGEMSAERHEVQRRRSEPSLFGFVSEAATIFQDALILAHVQGDRAPIIVKNPAHAGPLAEVALDDCAGAKVRLLRDSHGKPIEDAPWRHVQDVLELYPSSARLELVGAPQVTFEVPRHIGRLTMDPSDQFTVDGWRIRITADGLSLTGAGNGPVDIDGAAYTGPSRLVYQDGYRIRAGDGVFRILRGHTPSSLKASANSLPG